MAAGQLTLENIACVRGGRLLFKGINATLGPGDALLLRGPNGVGKSSLVRMIAGLLAPYAGRIIRSGRLALADEAHALDPRQPLGTALSFWAALDGSGSDAVREAMGAMRIVHLADVPVRMLSTGQKKRATLARVIASEADIWLLDEPGNGLDKESLTLLDAAMAVHRARGGLIVAASHQPIGLTDAIQMAIGDA